MQNLQIKITNNSSENTKYSIYVNTATTNQNDILDYSISDFDKDNSMKVSIKIVLIWKKIKWKFLQGVLKMCLLA